MTYTHFRDLVVSRSLPWFYKNLPDYYDFSSYEGPLIFDCRLFKTDTENVADFDENHKATAIDIT